MFPPHVGAETSPERSRTPRFAVTARAPGAGKAEGCPGCAARGAPGAALFPLRGPADNSEGPRAAPRPTRRGGGCGSGAGAVQGPSVLPLWGGVRGDLGQMGRKLFSQRAVRPQRHCPELRVPVPKCPRPWMGPKQTDPGGFVVPPNSRCSSRGSVVLEI